MTKKEIKKTINILFITDQIKDVDITKSGLSKYYVVNEHNASSTSDIKNILSFEEITLIVVGDQSAVSIGVVKSTINEVKKDIPIIQLLDNDSDKDQAKIINNGASAVVSENNPVEVESISRLMIDYYRLKDLQKQSETTIKGFKDRFNDLYMGLADPVCYVVDGIFVSCNPAFYRTFEVFDEEELSELTLLSFIDRKHQNDMKSFLRKASIRDLSASPITFDMKTKLGNEIEMLVMAKPAIFNGEQVTQIYLRSTKEGTGGGVLFDESTGLSTREQMDFYLQQQLQKSQDSEAKPGILVYLLIQNYREVWGVDGINEAEKLIQSTAKYLRQHLSFKTEFCRYTDDGILFYSKEFDKNKIESYLDELVAKLDLITPEGMKRMVEPLTFMSFAEITSYDEADQIISSLFRSVHSSSVSDNKVRVTVPSSISTSKRDSKRLEIINDVLKNKRINMFFQPIASFDGGNAERYRERVVLLDAENKPLENSIMIGIAERYNLTQEVDKWKVTNIFQKILALDIKQRENMEVFIVLSVSSLTSSDFTSWLIKQIKHTGLKGSSLTFEIMVETVQAAYSATIQFAQAIRDIGSKIAVSKVGSLNDDNKRVIDDIKPNFIKIDIREIDTLEEDEEVEVMTAIKEKADKINATIIAEYIESPAQLSRIWPYDIKLIQGDGMTPLLEDMNFNFQDFTI